MVKFYRAYSIDEYLQSAVNGVLAFSHPSIYPDKDESIDGSEYKNEADYQKLGICSFFTIPSDSTLTEEKQADKILNCLKSFHKNNEGMSKKKIVLEYEFKKEKCIVLNDEKEKNKYLQTSLTKADFEKDIFPMCYQTYKGLDEVNEIEEMTNSVSEEDIKKIFSAEEIKAAKNRKELFKNRAKSDLMKSKCQAVDSLEKYKEFLLLKDDKYKDEAEYRFFKYFDEGFQVEKGIFIKNIVHGFKVVKFLFIDNGNFETEEKEYLQKILKEIIEKKEVCIGKLEGDAEIFIKKYFLEILKNNFVETPKEYNEWKRRSLIPYQEWYKKKKLTNRKE